MSNDKSAEEIIRALRDGTETCAECQFYGEPCGCNRPDGECDGWDIGQAAADLIESQQAQLAEKAEAENRWIPVSERLPEPGERVIATNGIIVLEMYLRLFNQEMCWARYGIKLEDFYEPVTHWRPLPEPPAEEAAQ